MDSTKSIFASLSFWGLVVTVVAPLLAKYGIVVDQGSLTAQLAGLAGAIVGIYGIVRRPDIHVVPPG